MGRIELYSAILVLVAGLTSVSGCASSSPPTTTSSETDTLLERSHESYLKGVRAEGNVDTEQLKKARRYAETYLNRDPDGRHVAEAWYRIAQVEFHRGNYNNVIDATDNGLNAVRDPKIRAALLLLNGKAHAASEHEGKALEVFQSTKELIESNSSAAEWVNQAELEYRLAGALTRAASFQQAKNVLESVQQTYPDTDYGQNARDKLLFFRPFFSVQVGLFSEEDNAITMKRKLQRDGFDAYILSARSDGSTLYSVRTGKFDTYNDARNMKERLERNGIDAIVKP